MTLGNLANLDALTGRAEEARALCEQALAIHQELGNRREEGATLTNLASVLASLGRVAEARDAFARALRISREVGNRRFEGITLVYWAALERRLGAPGRAGEMLAEAAATFDEVGERLYAGVCRCELGHVALSRGEPAAELLEGARAVASAISARPGSELGQAIARLERALAVDPSALRFGECAEDVPAGIVVSSQ
jgi:tetratricopeptide (TPR) repeat protein